MKYKVGSNQWKKKQRKDVGAYMIGFLYLMSLMVLLYDIRLHITTQIDASESVDIITSQVAVPAESRQVVAQVATPAATLTPSPTPTELEEVVAYIARKFEPEGKQVVVRAINCFYSESGLRPTAVGQNKDAHMSKDHGVAQLNDYWHKLTEKQKTDIHANIDKAYDIYKGRGDSFSAWYGKLCN